MSVPKSVTRACKGTMYDVDQDTLSLSLYQWLKHYPLNCIERPNLLHRIITEFFSRFITKSPFLTRVS